MKNAVPLSLLVLSAFGLTFSLCAPRPRAARSEEDARREQSQPTATPARPDVAEPVRAVPRSQDPPARPVRPVRRGTSASAPIASHAAPFAPGHSAPGCEGELLVQGVAARR